VRAGRPCYGTAAFAVCVLLSFAGAGRVSGAGLERPGRTVVIDPGHDAIANPATEPIGPGSRSRKPKDGGGARGVGSGTTEAAVNLDISLRLRRLLRTAGVTVVMTRTATRGVSMGNVARAQIANRARAGLFLRVHADSSTSPTTRGSHTLYPALRRGWTDDIHGRSKRAAAVVQRALVGALGSRDLGLNERSDLTGFNWADVPAILVEVGFLSNPAEDRLLATAAYRQRAARGLCTGTLAFLDLGHLAGRCR